MGKDGTGKFSTSMSLETSDKLRESEVRDARVAETVPVSTATVEVAKTDQVEGDPSAVNDEQVLHQQATRLGLRLIGGLVILLLVIWVGFPLVRGGSTQAIEAAEMAVNQLYLSDQRDYLRADISEDLFREAKDKVQALGGWAEYRLNRAYDRAYQRYQAIQVLHQLYQTDQPLIRGDQVRHDAPLQAQLTSEEVQMVSQSAAVRATGGRDGLGQSIQSLIQEAGQLLSQYDEAQSQVGQLVLGQTIDRANLEEVLSLLEPLEEQIKSLSQRMDTQELSRQLAEQVKPFGQALAEQASDETVDEDLQKRLWACASLEEPLAGSAIDHRKLMSLTFDDGPHPEVTEKLLEVLAKHQVKATFFMMGGYVEKYPEVVRKVRDAGHQIGNHTYTHPDLATLSDEEVKKQIRFCQEVIEEAADVTPTLYRLPFGSGGERVIELLKPMKSIVWNVDSQDWKSHDKEAIIERVLTTLKPQTTLLMHDTHMSTVEAIDDLIPIFKEKGYHFVMPQQNDLGFYYY